MKKTSLILAALFVLATGNASAQAFSFNETNNLMYFAQRSPQSNQLNPAFFPSALYIALPGLNALQLGLPLSIGDIAYYDPAQEANIIDVNNVLNTLTDNNKFRMGLDLNIAGVGMRIAGVFVDANVQLKTNFNLGLPMDAVNFVLKGNVQPDGSAYPVMPILDGDFFNMQMYIETSVGAGFHVPLTGLTVGAHVKLLSGLINLQTENTQVTFNTSEDFNDVEANMYYEITGASVVPINTENGFDIGAIVSDIKNNMSDVLKSLYDINGGNTGYAFDLGAKYDIGPFTLSASIIDLSPGIHWQQNIVSMVPSNPNGSIHFSGMDISELLNEGNINTDSLTTYLNDQIKGMIPEFKINEGEYWYTIPTKMNLGATVNLGLIKAGVLFHGQWDRGLLPRKPINSINDIQLDLGEDGVRGLVNTFRFNTTVSAGVNLFNWIEVIAGSSFVYDGHSKIGLENFLNPGVGVFVTPATLFQVYVMADYASSIYFSQMKAFNFKLGFNLLVGGNSRSRIL